LLLILAGLSAPATAGFVTFESGQVRPLALAPSGGQLCAVNTPDNRLEIFDVAGGTLTHVGAVPVGVEPVAVAVRPDGSQAWVVNHLSDSVSVIDLTVTPPRVARTLLVGDEPRDIVFGGASPDGVLIDEALANAGLLR
jgi:YVTN family beta-propeller protein